MFKKFLALLLSVLLLTSMVFSVQAEATRSITLGALVTTTGTAESGDSTLIVYLTPVEVTAQEQMVLDSLAVHAETKPVAEYFAPETIAAVTELLPPETDTASLKLDEFHVLKTEGYTADHGDVQVAFEFVTPYTAESKLVGMVGIMPASLGEAAAAFEAAGLTLEGSVDENGVFWVAVKVEVIDGKVIVHLPQGVLELTLEYDTVFALLSAN